MKSIDLNCDMGEVPEAIYDGTQEALMQFLSSVNIACGGHAGDESTMRATVEQALRHNLAIGAHPGYPDRQHFGRMELTLAAAAIEKTVFQQTSRLGEIAKTCGAHVSHVKAHGALYNQAARDLAIASAIAHGVARWERNVAMVGLAGSIMLKAFREAGFVCAAEAFADRRYECDGSLRSRKFSDALIVDPSEAAEQVLRIVKDDTVIARDGTKVRLEAQTICVHGDTPGAVKIAETIAKRLQDSGISVRALVKG